MINFIKRNWLLVSLATVTLFTIFFFDRQAPTSSPDGFESFSENNNSDTQIPENNELDEQTIVVDIKGEVQQPGVYEVDIDFRVTDVVELAGGFTDDADEFSVNLAQKVQDEMVIYAPEISDGTKNTSVNSNAKIRINYATQEELETLTGIGPAKAQAIIKYRDEHGFFQQIEDLLGVSGIGEKALEQLTDEVQVP